MCGERDYDVAMEEVEVARFALRRILNRDESGGGARARSTIQSPDRGGMKRRKRKHERGPLGAHTFWSGISPIGAGPCRRSMPVKGHEVRHWVSEADSQCPWARA